MKIGRGAPTVSHLFFADDVVLYCRATNKEAMALKKILHVYGAALRQEVNDRKKSSFFIPNTGIGEMTAGFELWRMERLTWGCQTW